MSDILIENYIRFLIENENRQNVRTDLPIISNFNSKEEEEDEYVHNDVKTDLPIQKAASTSKIKKQKNGKLMKIALALAAASGIGLTVSQKSTLNKADNNPSDVRANNAAKKVVNYLSYVGDPDYKEKFSVEDIMWSKGVDKDELIDFIKHHESFSALPYYDNGNVTIGYGTNVDKNGKTGKEVNHPGLNSSNADVKEKAIKKAVNLAYESYGIKQGNKTKIATVDGLSEKDAKTILDYSLDDHISLLHRYSPWISNNDIPTNVLFVMYDMSYNIGPAVFSRLFKKTGSYFEKFSKALTEYEKSNDQKDIIDAIDNLYNVVKEIKDSNAYRSGVEARNNYINNNPNAATWKTRYELHIERLELVISDLEQQIH
jgi:hypothetical protein